MTPKKKEIFIHLLNPPDPVLCKKGTDRMEVINDVPVSAVCAAANRITHLQVSKQPRERCFGTGEQLKGVQLVVTSFLQTQDILKKSPILFNTGNARPLIRQPVIHSDRKKFGISWMSSLLQRAPGYHCDCLSEKERWVAQIFC